VDADGRRLLRGLLGLAGILVEDQFDARHLFEVDEEGAYLNEVRWRREIPSLLLCGPPLAARRLGRRRSTPRPAPPSPHRPLAAPGRIAPRADGAGGRRGRARRPSWRRPGPVPRPARRCRRQGRGQCGRWGQACRLLLSVSGGQLPSAAGRGHRHRNRPARRHASTIGVAVPAGTMNVVGRLQC
jgi:hypothetical protein